jgi:hypothetical protein
MTLNSFIHALAIVAVAAASIVPGFADEAPAAPKALSVAQLTAGGKLVKPADLANWVFLGTSLGMGYNPGSFNAARPGQFQVVLMEPGAYKQFIETRRYAPGTMLMLAFYDADTQKRSINQNGFTQAELTNYEIHLIDPKLGPDGRVFYLFDRDATEGSPLPPGNACVRCHKDHGAYDGTFAQFYPTIRPLIPKEMLDRVKSRDIQ